MSARQLAFGVAAVLDVERHRALALRLRQDIEYMAREAKRLAEPAEQKLAKAGVAR